MKTQNFTISVKSNLVLTIIILIASLTVKAADVNIVSTIFNTQIVASTEHSAGFNATKLADGTPSSGWFSSDNAPLPQIVIFKFAKKYKLTLAKVFQSQWAWASTYRTKDFIIEGSVDGIDYQSLGSGSLTDDPNSTWEQVLTTDSLKSVKITVNTSYSAIQTCGLGEVEFYANIENPIVLTAPDKPINLSAIAGNQQATVSFTAPANNGGSQITNYSVTANPGNIIKSSFGSPIILNGLTNNTAYTFTVVATNNIGNSLPSDASVAVIPLEINYTGIQTNISPAIYNTQIVASSEYSSSFAATNLASGDPISGWFSPDGVTLPQNVVFTFAKKYKVSQIKLYQSQWELHTYRTKDFLIEGSADGATYQPLATGSLTDDFSDMWSQNLYVDSLMAIRINVVSSYSATQTCGLGEVEIFANITNGTSLNSINDKDVRIYPNIVKDIINISGLSAKSTIDIFTLNGQVVNKNQSEKGGNIAINIQNLKSGAYLIRIASDSGNTSHKFIKE